MNRIFFFLFFFAGITANAQYVSGVTSPDLSSPIIADTTQPNVKFANTISAEDMKKHLSILASDEFEGRETGERGNDDAAAYIGKFFNSLILNKVGENYSYYQPVSFTFSRWEEIDMFLDSTRYKHLWDFLAFPSLNKGALTIQDEEIIFMGYGIEDEKYNDYRKAKDLEGKIIMINKGEPVNKDSLSRITGTETFSEWSTDINKKLRVAKEKGVKLVLIIEDNIQGMLAQNRRKLLGASVELGDKSQSPDDITDHVYISTTIAKDIIGGKSKKIIKARKKANKKGKFKPVKLKQKFLMNFMKNVDLLKGNNIVGLIEGTDKRDEIVVVSAHYDHLGKRGDEIFNGADDNGSGTTTVLELAEAFAAARDANFRPKRSILFLLVTGEEKGLLGSQYYAENPIFPLENTVVDVNIDMVGRTDMKYKDSVDYIYVIGSDRLSTDLHKINEEVNEKYAKLTLDYTYNSEDDPNRYYFRSDHYNFAKNGVPAIFYFNGTHDDYHRSTDTVEKIDFETMEKRGKLFFHTIWELANRSDRIVVDGEVK